MARGIKTRRWLKGNIQIETFLAFGFGVLFLIAMLTFAVFFPNPTEFQIRVFVTVLALAAGGIGAVIPGQFNIQHKNFIRAGGALALVAMVYLLQPTLEGNIVNLQEPTTSADPTAEAFLNGLDSGNIDAAWALLDPVMIAAAFPDGKSDFLELYQNTRAKISEPVSSREVINRFGEQSPDNLPVGIYRFITYRSHLADQNMCFSESVRLRATQDLEWRINSYYLDSPQPC